jgi:hypothetical protein
MRPKTIQPMMDIDLSGLLPRADFRQRERLLLPTKPNDKSKPHPEHHASLEQVFTA